MKNTSNVQLTSLPKEILSNPLALYKGLKNMDNSAIDFLHQKIKRHLNFRSRQYNASPMDLEELANDAILLALRKISDGSYSYEGYSPVTFAGIVADNLLRNFCRKKHRHFQELESVNTPSVQPEVEAYLAQKELKNQMEKAISKLSATNQLVIRLKYYDDLKDEEIVSKGLVPHRTTDSLKSARCRSLKRLAALMRD